MQFTFVNMKGGVAGVYYPPLPLWTVSSADGGNVPTLHWNQDTMAENVYFLNLEAIGGCLDGKPMTDVVIASKNSNGSHSDKYGLAQFINHPPRGKRPSVISVPFLWKDAIGYFIKSKDIAEATALELKQQLESFAMTINPLARGPWFVDPVTADVVTFEQCNEPANTAGCAFVLCHDLDSTESDNGNGNDDSGVELLFDYKFSKRNEKKLPDWYTPVDSTGQ